MTLSRTRMCAGVCTVLGLALTVLPPALSPVRAEATAKSHRGPCGVTTLEGVLADAEGDGVVECVAGDARLIRKDLAGPLSQKSSKATPIISFVLLSDLHQGDEELTLPSRTNWRNWAALAPYMLNAQVKAINAIAAKRSPVSKQPISMVFSLGDDADNAQYNEMRLTTDTLAGHRLVDTNSGAPGHDDPNEIDPRGKLMLPSPVAGQRIVDLANRPFYASGLHYSNGAPIPWYLLHGNHNSKVMGGIPHDDSAWRKIAGEWAVGNIQIANLNARLAGELAHIRDHSPDKEPAFWTRVFKLARSHPGAVGDVRTVKADPRRRILSREQWISDVAKAPGAPTGHGFLPTSNRCPDVYANGFARRACYVVDKGQVRFIALDDSALQTLTGGSVDDKQLEWLERELVSSSRTYFDRSGRRKINELADDRYVVVMSHHTSAGMNNGKNAPGASGERYGADLEKLLLRFPNVILHASGHSHTSKTWLRRDRTLGTGYWEVATPSLVDGPHSGRVMELVRNTNGTLTISSTLFEPRVDPNPRHIDWKRDDPTDETDYGAKHAVNEDWLAAAGLEAAEAQRTERRYGKPKDRNISLVIADPRVMQLRLSRSSSVPGYAPVSIAGLGFAILVLLVRRRRPPKTPTMTPRGPVQPPRRRGPKPERRVPVGAGSSHRSAA